MKTQTAKKVARRKRTSSVPRRRDGILTIVLARHGKPDWDEKTLIPGHGLRQWVRGRDAAPIVPSVRPPEDLVRLGRSCRVVAASTLRRSLESAELVVPGIAPRVHAMFKEVAPPTQIRIGLRLRPQLWSWLARAAWYCGWSPGVESYAEARERAAAAAEALTDLALEEESVILVGHGIMNGMIGKQLRHAGWSGPLLRPRRLWAHATYHFMTR